MIRFAAALTLIAAACFPAAAQTQAAPEGEVTYEQLLKDPDNADLNYRYAAEQVRKGHLTGAMTALERVLTLQPEDHKARLLYAIVLTRLDSLQEAEQTLDTLKGKDLPESLRARAEDALRRVRQRGRRNHIRLLAGAGFDYDDNRNASPASGQRLFLDTPVTLTPSSARKEDTAALLLGEMEFSRDLGAQARHKALGSYSYYQSAQSELSRLDLQNHSLKAGGVYRGSWVDVSPTFEFDHLLLAKETYLRSRSVTLRFDRRLGARFNAFGEAAHTDHRYNRTPVAPTGSERTGDRIEGGVGLGVILFRGLRLTMAYERANIGAAEKYLAYARDSEVLRLSWLLPHGQFLLSSLTMNQDRYERPDAAISAAARRDETYRTRLTYGVPLSLLAKPLSGLVWTLSYEYYRANSNIANYEYGNNSVSSMMTYRWDHGF